MKDFLETFAKSFCFTFFLMVAIIDISSGESWVNETKEFVEWSLKKVFKWKFLSEDGLIKDHRPLGTYYSQTRFDDEFDTEEDALAELINWKKIYEYQFESEMVLLTIYREVWE